MPNTKRFYRFVIRNADDDGDEIVISSFPGDDNVFLLEPPRGDGQSFDPLTGKITTGQYTIRVIDAETDVDTRVITAILADVNARQQFLSRVAIVSQSSDGISWDELQHGYINGIRMDGGLVFDFSVGDTQRIEVSTEIFREVQPGLGYPTCIMGGPILMPAGETFATLRNFGGFGYKVDAVFTTPDYVRLKVIPGKLFDPRKANQGEKYQRLSVFSSALADAGNQFIRPYFEPSSTWTADNIKGWFPGVAIRLEETDGTFVGLFTPLTKPSSNRWWEGADHSNLWIDNVSGTDEDGEPLGTWTPTVGHEYRLYEYIRTVSEDSPMHYSGHPVDLWEQIRIAANIPYDDTVLSAVKAQVGNDVRIELRITQSYKIGEFDEKVIYGPFGLSTRMVDGKRQLFSSRTKSATVPSETITLSDLRNPGKPFDLDETTAIKRVELKQIRLTPWLENAVKKTEWWDLTPTEQTSTQPPIDGVIASPLTQSIDNSDDDATVTSAGDLTYDIPGQIIIGGAYAGKYGALKREIGWLAGVADEIFDRWGRGIIGGEFRCLPSVTALIGEELLATLPHMPVSKVGESPVTQRGLTRIIQIVGRTETPSGPNIKWLDAGSAGDTEPGEESALTVPTFTVAANSDDPRKYVDVTITNGPAIAALGGRIRVWVATGASPASGSGSLSTVIDPAVDALTFTLPAFDAGTHVWVQLQTVVTDERPSVLSAFDDVALDVIDPVTSLAVTSQDAGDPSRRTLSWVIGTNADDIPVEVLLRLTSESASANRVVAVLPPGSTQYELTGLDATNKTATVRHHESAPFNGVSTSATVAVNTSGTARTLNPPTSPRGFSFGDGRYGMDVIATEFPSSVEFQVKVGAGSYETLAIIASEESGRTTFSDIAPNDGETRTMKARHVSEGLTASAFTAEVTADAWTSETPSDDSVDGSGFRKSFLLMGA